MTIGSSVSNNNKSDYGSDAFPYFNLEQPKRLSRNFLNPSLKRSAQLIKTKKILNTKPRDFSETKSEFFSDNF